MKEPSVTMMIVTFVGTFILAGIVRAIVIASLWGWFIAPAFHLPEMPLITAYAVSMLVGLFANYDTSGERFKGKELGEIMSTVFATAVLSPLMTLGLGWVLHVLVPLSG